MAEQIQLQTSDRLMYFDGLYVLQLENAIEAGYPVNWKHTHLEWLSLERFGLIKVGITQWDIDDRITRLSNISNWYMMEVSAYRNLRPAKIRCVGCTFTNLLRTYENWIHQSLRNHRISKEDMGYLGREWFIPTDNVTAFLKDVLEQIRSAENEDDKVVVLRTFSRLARIRQAHFGGVLIEPVLDRKEGSIIFGDN